MTGEICGHKIGSVNCGCGWHPSCVSSETESSALDVQIAAVLELHRPYGLDCKCDVPINSDAGWSAHAAAAVTDLLVDLAGTGRLLASIDRLYRHGAVVSRHNEETP